MKNSPSISFYTFGCRLNQSETAVIERSFGNKGYRVVDVNDPADIVVINTCTVTENGDADARRFVNKISNANPSVKIALVGCQAQIQKEKLAALPNVRWIIGNAKKMDLLSIIEESEHQINSAVQVITPTIPKESFTIPHAAIDKKHTRATIKIQDGCDFFCSFCEIPYARGRARSRDFHDIINEAQTLAGNNFKEIILTGINIGTYDQPGKSFMDVIDALEQIDGIERIRISSIEPTTIPKKLIEKMSRKTKLCRYLHIPLQSANDNVLSAMKRKYTFKEYEEFIHTAHRMIPQLSIGTDIIVGFPTEEEKHFEETFNRLNDLPIHYIHVFSYSDRHLAKSRVMRDKKSGKIIADRSKRLRDLSFRKRQLFNRTLLSTQQKVLFEKRKTAVWEGFTDNYVRVSVDSNKHLENTIRDVSLVSLNKEHIIGKLIKK